MKVLLVCLLLLLTHSSIIALKRARSTHSSPQSSKQGHYSFSLNSLVSGAKGSSQAQTQRKGECSGPTCNPVPTTDVSNSVDGSGNKVYG